MTTRRSILTTLGACGLGGVSRVSGVGGVGGASVAGGVAALAGVPGPARAGAVDWINRVKLGSTLPEFEARYLNTAPVDDARLLLIDFWATWCAPSREYIPRFNNWQAAYRSQGLSIIGLTKEQPELVLPYMARVPMHYPVGVGEARGLQAVLGVRALPYSIFVDRSKTIVWRGQPEFIEATLIESLLKSAA